MKHLIASLFVAASLLAAPASAQKLTFDEAVQRAVDRASDGARARLAVAAANERYLEAQSKFHWDFRPKIGLLAFSNPALLASSIGMGMAIGRNRPPAWVRQSARLDALEAEVALERSVTTARLEVSRQYFQVLLRQQTRDELAQAVRQQRTSQQTLQQRSRSRRLTTLDHAIGETRLIAIEAQLEEAESSLADATILLAQTTGIEEPTNVLQLAALSGASAEVEVPTTTTLQNVLLKRRNIESKLRTKINAEKTRIFGKSALGINPLSANYNHLSDRSGSGPRVGQGGYLLGGDTASVDLGIKLSLRRTGEEEALAQLAAARIKAIELDLRSVGDTVQQELNSLRGQLLSSKRKAELAARRLKLYSEVSRLLSIREESGLESAEVLLSAEAELVRIRSAYQQAEAETNTRWMHLLAACDLADVEGAKTMLVGQASAVVLDAQSHKAIQ